MTTDGGKTPQVVVGVDGSAESVAALKWAAAYKAATGAAIHAVLAWHYPSAVGPGAPGRAPASITEEVRTEMTQHLTTAIEQAGAGIETDQQITYGHPVEVLVNASSNADLLVVGSRGHGAFHGMLVGSVSIGCVTHAHCPVVVVRGGES
jgi:nucleotide-binding universal stress UspA family protein